MLAALTIAGLPVRPASATKNVLAATMNASAVASSCSHRTCIGERLRCLASAPSPEASSARVS